MHVKQVFGVPVYFMSRENNTAQKSSYCVKIHLHVQYSLHLLLTFLSRGKRTAPSFIIVPMHLYQKAEAGIASDMGCWVHLKSLSDWSSGEVSVSIGSPDSRCL